MKRNAKRNGVITTMVIVLMIALVKLATFASAATWKLPKPPAKVFEDGSPWVAVDKEIAKVRSQQVPQYVLDVLEETKSVRQARLGKNQPTLADVAHRYMILDSPLINDKSESFGDIFEPVRFMHMGHASTVSDCTTCHHFRPKDMNLPEITKCSACHQKAFNPETSGRLGLKAAYHQQCMGCHQEEKKGPVDCIGCHSKNVPDHQNLVQLPENPDPISVTKECLRCHDESGNDMLTSAHWLWKGPSPNTVGSEKRVDLGKATNTINNFCVALPSNWPRCTSCHAGYGWKDANFDFNDKTKMDCLVCHDTTQTYAKVPVAAGMPYEELNLKVIAQSVGKPSRKTCGDCHFQGGGGDAVKHGDLNEILNYPSRECDIHMGGMDFQCHDCHKTRNHKISGRSLSLPVVEGTRTCEDCHTDKPHKFPTAGQDEMFSLLNFHLNEHVEHIQCQTCHSPVFSKCKPTKTWWDWSKAGDKNRKIKKDKYGMPDYSWNKGEFEWKESAKPDYLWFNGDVERYIVGDKFKSADLIKLTEPVGFFIDPKSRIYPFKTMKGKQMADARHNTLIVPHLFGPQGYWTTLDWQKSFELGMEAANLPYSGEYKWVETIMYWGLNHEIMPAKNALGCTQCHESLKGDLTCNRCHQDNRDVDFDRLTKLGTDFSFMIKRGRDVSHLVGKSDYIDFKALGYKGDPIIYGGRFKKLPMGYSPLKRKKQTK